EVGLALATAVGAWVNFLLLVWFAVRKRLIAVDARLARSLGRLAIAGLAMAVVLWLAQAPVEALFARWATLRYEATLLTLGAIGACAYSVVVLALFGREWLALFQRRATGPAKRACCILLHHKHCLSSRPT